MPQQPSVAVDNNFAGGLITEASGLNFPPNAVIASQNCIHTILGTVTRRLGFDYETAAIGKQINRSGNAIVGYLWRNVNGDGNVFLYVLQVGSTLYFYNVDITGSSISTGALANTINLNNFSPSGAPANNTVECQFSAGQGFLFVTHPYLESFVVQYNSGPQTFVTQQSTIRIRDFIGINEPGVPINFRPPSLTSTHQYNLQNQGWTAGAAWTATSTTPVVVGLGAKTWTIQTGLTITNGQIVNVALFIGRTNPNVMSGSVTSYNSGTGVLVLNIYAVTNDPSILGQTGNNWTLSEGTGGGFLNKWNTAEGNYPSNSDVWWTFKDTTDVFNPTLTVPNISLNAGQAPNGHYILPAFNQDRSLASGISGFTPVTSSFQRPATSAFFAGRVFWSGVNYQNFSNNIYFTQILKTADTNDVTAIDFGACFQDHDPTGQNISDLLADDGGVIKIAECGTIFKLFPIQGALLVFASNGIWTVTGSQGLGFSANDYSVNKLSAIRCLSATSFVDVLGFPIFWTREGIYTIRVDVTAGGLRIDSLTDTTIRTFYNKIPQAAKATARGYYNPISFTVQWLYRSTTAASINDTYNFDSILNFNTLTGAFFPWSFAQDHVVINGLTVVDVFNSGASNLNFKYLVSAVSGGANFFTFAEEKNTTFVDWFGFDQIGETYTSTFTGAYRLSGSGVRRWQVPYLYVFMDSSVLNNYTIQGYWDYALTSNTSKQTPIQVYNPPSTATNYSLNHHRWKIRGRGLILQFKITSQDGKPMNLTGWTVWEEINSGP